MTDYIAAEIETDNLCDALIEQRRADSVTAMQYTVTDGGIVYTLEQPAMPPMSDAEIMATIKHIAAEVEAIGGTETL